MSDDAWLALPDGTVVKGHWLHRPKDSTYKTFVHDWFYEHEGSSLSCHCEPFNSMEPVAFALILPPAHPKDL